MWLVQVFRLKFICACSLTAMARLFTFSELRARNFSSSPRFLLFRCFEVLLFCLLVSVFTAPRGAYFLVSSNSKARSGVWKEREERKGKGKREQGRKERKGKEKKSKDRLYSGSFYLSTRSPSGPSLSLPHPHSSFPTLSSARCSSHPRVSTPALWIKPCSIVTPLGVNRRECSLVSL